ncbi:MAG: hypothetical protein Q9181_004660 [Wetmoreana brouardii]
MTVEKPNEANLDEFASSSNFVGENDAFKEFNPKAPTRPSGKKRKLDEVGWLERIRSEVENVKNHPHAVKELYEVNEDNDQVVDIVKLMVTTKPEDRLSANNAYRGDAPMDIQET